MRARPGNPCKQTQTRLRFKSYTSLVSQVGAIHAVWYTLKAKYLVPSPMIVRGDDISYHLHIGTTLPLLTHQLPVRHHLLRATVLDAICFSPRPTAVHQSKPPKNTWNANIMGAFKFEAGRSYVSKSQFLWTTCTEINRLGFPYKLAVSWLADVVLLKNKTIRSPRTSKDWWVYYTKYEYLGIKIKAAPNR